MAAAVAFGESISHSYSRGSTVALSGCGVCERKCCGRSPVAKPPTARLSVWGQSWTLNAALPASLDLGNNRQSSFSSLENEDKQL